MKFLLYRSGISLVEYLCLKFYSFWYTFLHCFLWETSEGILGVVICILEVGQCKELPLFFQVIQRKFGGKSGNYLLLNKQKTVTTLFLVLNYVAKLHILTIVHSIFKSSFPSFTMVWSVHQIPPTYLPLQMLPTKVWLRSAKIR